MTRRRLLSGATALPLAGVAGCVVTPYGSYFRPSSDDPRASLRQAWCQGKAGPHTQLQMALGDGVALSARADRDESGRDREGWPMRVLLTLPGTTPARFAGSQLQLIEAANRRSLSVPIKVTASRTVDLDIEQWVDAARLRPAGAAAMAVDSAKPHGQAYLRFETLEGFGPERLVLDSLRVEQTGAAAWSLPSQDLTRQAGAPGLSRYYRSAAQQARLLVQADACRRDTPQRACDNLPRYSDESFSFADAMAQWQGSWRTFDSPGQAVKLYAELRMAPQRSEPWRLAARSLVLRDPVGDTTRQLPIRGVTVVYNDRVALDAPLQGDGGTGRGETRVSIEALLPVDVPDFELRLPALLHGGRELAVPTIRFERRRFDGGIEPFNC